MIKQNKNSYRYSLDPFLLCDFFSRCFVSKENKNYRVADFCSGSGIIAFFIAKKYPDFLIDGVEIQDELYQSSIENLHINKEGTEEGKIRFIHNDLRKYKKFLEHNVYDNIIS
ncbi:MAG: methyltransferase, partial [Nitrospinae bacterium]|nr:methyltransferase [Nitrospinota bacterium]